MFFIGAAAGIFSPRNNWLISPKQASIDSHWMGSGRVVKSLDFYPALLKSLGYFDFQCILSLQWKAVTVNLQCTMPTLKACSQSVPGNKQEVKVQELMLRQVYCVVEITACGMYSDLLSAG